MPQTVQTSQLKDAVLELLSFQPAQAPVLSLYLDTRPIGQRMMRGRRERPGVVWLRDRLRELESQLPPRGPRRESFDADVERVFRFLENELDPATQGLALFACHQAGLWRVFQLEVPFANRLVVNDVPRVYPLAVLLDSYRPCAVVLTNSQQARIYTVILGKIQESASLENPYEPLQRPGRGHTGPRGFQPELKFQRHFEQHAHHHLREVLETLERIVREENLQHLVLGGEEQALAELRRMLPKHLQEKVLDIVEMDVHTPEREVLRETLKILQERMAREGERKVETLLAESLAGGLAAVGVPATLNALNLGNVSELLLADNLSGKAYFCQGCQLLFEESAQDGRCQSCQGPLEPLDLVEALTAQARRIDAAIDLIQGSEELRRVGGVGAFLRYRLAPAEEEKITTQTS